MVSALDAFLMSLIYLKTYANFSTLASVFGLKKGTFTNTMARILETIHNPLMETFVKPTDKRAQLLAGDTFVYFRCSFERFSRGSADCGLFISTHLSEGQQL
jgi:hypothetical protein